MRKVRGGAKPDIRPEYDFAAMKGGVRGKYVARYRAGTNLVLLQPGLARAFPTDQAVNETLRAVLSLTKKLRLKGISPQPARAARQPDKRR